MTLDSWITLGVLVVTFGVPLLANVVDQGEALSGPALVYGPGRGEP